MRQIFFLFFALLTSWATTGQEIQVIGNSKGNSIFSYTKGEGQVFWTDAVAHPEGFYTLAGIVLSKGVHYLALARFLPDGKPDCSFQNEGISKLTIPVNWEYMVKIERTRDGLLLVLFNPPQQKSDLYLGRFYEDGYPDPSFGENGILRLPVGKPTHFLDMILQQDGGILVAGFEENHETNAHTCSVYRVLPEGRIDPAFHFPSPEPTPHSYHLLALESLPDGKVLLAAFRDGQLCMGRLLPDGSLDPGFGKEGKITYPLDGFRPYDVILAPDSSWLVLGSGHPGQRGWPLALKCNYDGKPDPDFGFEGVLYNPLSLEIAASGIIQPDGKWLTAGMVQSAEHISSFLVRRFLPDGSPDKDFGSMGRQMPRFEEEDHQGSAMFITPLKEGGFLAGGTVNFKGALAKLDESGTLANSFGEKGRVVSVWGGQNPLDVECYKLLSREDGSLLAAGTIQKPFESEILAIRLEGDGELLPEWINPVHLSNPIVGIDAALQPDGKLVVGGRTRTRPQDLDYAACRLNPDGSLDTTFGKNGIAIFDRGPFDVLGGMALQEDGKILLAGDMENMQTHSRELVVYRLLPSGEPDPSFGQGGICALSHSPNGAFSGLLLQKDGRILLLDAHPPFSFDIIRLLPNGKWDRSFGIDGVLSGSFPDSLQTSLESLQGAVTPNNHILIAGQMGTTLGLIRFKHYGEPDTDFGNKGLTSLHLPETFWEMTVLHDGKILLAGSGCSDYFPYNYFFGARFTPGGMPDPGFGENGLVITSLPAFSYLSSLLVMEDGTAILGGKGYDSPDDNYTDILLVRYLPDLDAGHLCPKHIFPFMDVYPYPMGPGAFTLTYDLPAKTEVIVRIVSEQGGNRATLFEGCRLEGTHTDNLTFPEGFPEGRYLLEVQTEEITGTIRIIHLHGAENL